MSKEFSKLIFINNMKTREDKPDVLIVAAIMQQTDTVSASSWTKNQTRMNL